MNFRLVIDPEKEEEIVATVHSPSPLTDELEQLVRRYSGCDKIIAYTDDDVILLSFSDIECITVLAGKTYAVDRNGTHHHLKQRLYELEAVLPSNFLRINKSSIANEDHLVRFTASFSGAVDAVFKCGYKEYVSRRCYAAIKRRFQTR